MDFIALANTELCLICNEYLNSYQNHVSINASYSEKSLASIIESFIEVSLPENVMTEGAVCQSCLIKVNEYDLYTTRATQLKDELINTLRTSKSFEKITEFQLDEDFPEIEFDFDVSGLFSAKKIKKVDKVNLKKLPEIKSEERKVEIKKLKRSKPPIRLITCDFCGLKDFKNRRYLISHVKSHLKTQFNCQSCQISFKTKNSLIIHLSSDHDNIKTNIPCPFPECGKNFSNKAGLRAHFICHNKHEKNPAFVCETCGKGFHYKLSFTQHLKIHSGVRDKKCEICGFKAISTTHLQRHIRARHTKEKPNVCSFCNRAFSERYNLMSHVRKQHLEKKIETVKHSQNFFKCDFCCMEFFDDFKLKQHMETNHNVVEVEVEAFLNNE